jgi:hypothetical protein
MADYPVQVTYAPDEGQNRLWGIPIVGVVVRLIMCIPQAIVLLVLSIVLYVVLLVNWIPVLVNGRQASWIYMVAGGYLRLTTRVSAFTLLLTGKYPPFGPGGEHTVNVTFDETETQNRLWGIPFFGILVRWIVLLPHWFVLVLLSIVASILALFTWVPILLNGRTSEWAVKYVGGFYRYSARVLAYGFLLTGRYPPFSLD